MHDVNAGDTAWVLASAALVMFMTPGLAFFYGGLVRAKNVLGTMMQSFIALALVTVLWVLIGYTLAFGPDQAGLIEHPRRADAAGPIDLLDHGTGQHIVVPAHPVVAVVRIRRIERLVPGR